MAAMMWTKALMTDRCLDRLRDENSLIWPMMVSAMFRALSKALSYQGVTAQVPPEHSGYAESADQRLRVLGQSVNDVPALLPGGRDEGADHGEVASPFLRPEAAGDFLPDLHHAPVALGLIVGEGHGGIVQEAQHVVLAGAETQKEIVAGASWRSPPSLAAAVGCWCGQRRLVLVEREPLGDDDVIAAPELVDKAGVERHAPGEMGGMTGAAQQAPHPARPLFLLGVDQRLENAQVMGVAQGMQHPFHRVVGLPVVMHNDAHNVRQQAAAPGRDAIEGQPHGARDVQPLRSAADPEAGLVQVLDRRGL